MHEKTVSLKDLQISYILKGLLWSVIIMIILTIFCSLLLQYTSLSEKLLPSFSTFIFFISMFFGATIAAYNAGHKGLLYSSTVSFSYFFLITLLGLFFGLSSISLGLLLKKTLLAIAASLLGGIIGIGLVSH